MHTTVFTLLIGVLSSVVALAEPVDQSVTLQPGWNSIFLEVTPDSPAPADVFAGIADLQSVWKWNARTGTVEFIQNPDLLVPDAPQMLVYIPGNPVVTNLHAIQGNAAYLVQMGGGTSVALTVSGEPEIQRPKWKSNSFNFVGFHLTEGAEPLFQDFFTASPAHAGQDIYVLDNATGTWNLVTSPTESMRRGEGFWVYCQGSSEFAGPVAVTLEQSTGLHFGTELSEQNLYLHNRGASEKTVTLSLPALTGTVRYWVFDLLAGFASWEPMPATLDLAVPAGGSQKIRLGVKRAGLAVDTAYQTNLGVTDGEGVSFLLPLSVTGIDYHGLWTGYASITKVSDQNKVDENGVPVDTPLPAGSTFDFRLILHADSGDTIRLLSQVIQMWEEGTLKPDPDNLGRFVVDDPGQFVLLVDDNLIGDYSGSLLRDGQPIGRRISAPVLPRLTAVEGQMAKSGPAFPQPGSVLTLTVSLAADDPTNPFRHLFHPSHKTLDQSIAVERNITMTFADEDGDGNPITGLPSVDRGSREIGGIYEETITGMHKLPIRIAGTFVLRRVSDIATLTQ